MLQFCIQGYDLRNIEKGFVSIYHTNIYFGFVSLLHFYASQSAMYFFAQTMGETI